MERIVSRSDRSTVLVACKQGMLSERALPEQQGIIGLGAVGCFQSQPFCSIGPSAGVPELLCTCNQSTVMLHACTPCRGHPALHGHYLWGVLAFG